MMVWNRIFLSTMEMVGVHVSFRLCICFMPFAHYSSWIPPCWMTVTAGIQYKKIKDQSYFAKLKHLPLISTPPPKLTGKSCWKIGKTWAKRKAWWLIFHFIHFQRRNVLVSGRVYVCSTQPAVGYLYGGFKYVLCSPLLGERFPIWLIFFRWVETTN